MGKKKILLCCAIIELAVIILIATACFFDNWMYYIFYNLLYGIVVSVSIPVLVLIKEEKQLDEAGIKKLGRRQIAVLTVFVVFSVGGRLIPKMIAGEQIPWTILPVGIAPLIMTTFFEEFPFHSFIQMRLKKEFGWVAAVFVSGLSFSLYHLGYPGFRTYQDIALLFAVGIGFALSFQLSGNNLIVSYFVNLPNAFVTYVFKYEQFPKMTGISSFFAVITIIIVTIIILNLEKVSQKEKRVC